MMNKKLFALLLLPVLAFTFTACQQTDVVANTAITSFAALLAAVKDHAQPTDTGYAITSPAGTERFLFGDKVAMELELAPFVNAGLDAAKLPDGYAADGDKLIISAANAGYTREATAAALFEKLVRNNRAAIGYHAPLDHYGLKIGIAGAFEWAKDMTANDKDIVFVLDPAPFIAAGVDPAQVAGWAFKLVEIVENGQTITVDRLLKPYNII
jgi:hypothetical protein